jgi:IclR family mhp operon transcriptional activator
MRPRTESEYTTVRSLVRGLDLLCAMNSYEKGRASLAQLAEHTGLHRTTVRRLLETLIDEGYVRRSESDDRYVLALKVRSLSEGFTDDVRVASVAGPALAELIQQVRWPSDLCTPDGGSMLIRESTHRFSPLSFHKAMVGQRLPMLLTAAGRAYFAYCADEEREALLTLLRHDPQQQRFAGDARFIDNLLTQTRSRGYASNEGDWAAEHKVGAIAIPLFVAGRTIASINIIYLTRAISHAEAAVRYLPALHRAGRQIEAALAEPAPEAPEAPTP